MVEWLRPKKPQYQPQPPPRRDPDWEYRNIPSNPPPAAVDRRGVDESQLPPNLRRYHTQPRQPLSDRLQERREEFREYYGTQPDQGQQYIPEPPPKRSKIPLILVSSNIALVIIGIVIAVINILYVRNAGQTIQSLTMIHGEMILVLLCVLINTLLTKGRK